MKKIKFHFKQILITWSIRKKRGEMDLITFHSWRIYHLWKYRYTDKNEDLNEFYF